MFVFSFGAYMRSLLTLLIVPILAIFSTQTYGQNPFLNQKPLKHEETSTDLYCESMALSFIEVALDYAPPSSQEHAKRANETQAELIKICKSMPIVGHEKRQRDMTKQEIYQLACLGMAEGIAMAHASKTEDRSLYSKLIQNRHFFENACTTNRTQFLSDMKKYGPYHVLNKTY